MGFTDELLKFALLLFKIKTCPAMLYTRARAALVAITQNVFLQDQWELGTGICGGLTTT